ncbi:MAG: hypothetical protein IPN71_03205 [Fibrobacteres bacterium]|nr:hypothetical protein [Fibrobacterota bacterium]
MSKNPLTTWLKGGDVQGQPKYFPSKEELLLIEEWVRCRDSGKIPLMLEARMNELQKRRNAVEAAGDAWFQRGLVKAKFAELKASIATGKDGKNKQIENAKAKRRREKVLKTEKNAPRVKVLVTLKEKLPDATLPQAARELVDRGLMGECSDPERAAKKWIQDHAKDLPEFRPGDPGHPLGIPNRRKP